MQNEWKGFEQVSKCLKLIQHTKEGLTQVANAVCNLPRIKVHQQIQKLINDRKQCFETDKLDWAMGEHLAMDLYYKKDTMYVFLVRT
jgi:2-oxoglutarate dehydrogenase E1 component